MLGSGVPTYMVPTLVLHRRIQLVLCQRPIITVVLAAVRTTSAFTLSFGALLVNGAAQIARATTAASASSQDRARIQFSGAAFVFHRSSATSITWVHACYSFLVTVVQPSRITVQLNSALLHRDFVSISLVGSLDDVLQSSL